MIRDFCHGQRKVTNTVRFLDKG